MVSSEMGEDVYVFECPTCEGCGKESHWICMGWGKNPCQVVIANRYESDNSYDKEKADEQTWNMQHDPVPYSNWNI